MTHHLVDIWKQKNLRSRRRSSSCVPVSVTATDGRFVCFACDVSDCGMKILSEQVWPYESVVALSYRDPLTQSETVALGWVRHCNLVRGARGTEGTPLVTLGIEFLDHGEPTLPL